MRGGFPSNATGGGGGPSPAAPALVYGTTNVQGVSGKYIPTDSTVAIFDATNPSTLAFGQAPVVGTALFGARRDHGHGMPASPAGGGIADIVRVIDPRVAITNGAWALASRAVYGRSVGVASISNVGIKVGTASGNVSVATYSNSGSGRTAVPNTRRQTSGAVACPASGFDLIALGGADSMADGDWLALSCDNTTATFDRTVPTVGAQNDAFVYTQNAAHPLPNPAVPVTIASATVPALVGS